MSMVNLEMRCGELGMTLKEGVSVCKRFGVPKRVISKGAKLKYIVDSDQFDDGLRSSMTMFRQKVVPLTEEQREQRGLGPKKKDSGKKK